MHRRYPVALLVLVALLAGCGGEEEISEQAELTPEEAGVTTEDFHWETRGADSGLPEGELFSIELTPEAVWVTGDGRLYRSGREGFDFSVVTDENLPAEVQRVTYANGVLWALGSGAAYSADEGTGWRSARLPGRDEGGGWRCLSADVLGDDAYIGTDAGLVYNYSFNPRSTVSFNREKPLMGAEIGYRRITDVRAETGDGAGIWAVSPDEYGFLARLDPAVGRWVMIHPYDPFNRVEVRDERVWAGSEGMGLFRSEDGGDSFYEVNPGGDWKNVNGIALGAGSCWAATDGGAVYYPYSDGRWEFHGVQEGADYGVMHDVVFDEEANTAYFATEKGLAVGVKEGPPAPPPEDPTAAGDDAAEENVDD